MRDIIIVGGGASGLIAAAILARHEKEVTLLEHNDKIGRKILATGNGKCNFTNQLQEESCYRGEHPDFSWNLIQKYGTESFLSFLDTIGIVPKSKNGYYYPYSEQASTIVESLQQELSFRKVKVKCQEHVTEILPIKGGYSVVTKGYAYEAKKVIIACGGKATPVLGADGSGYELAKKLGYTITPLFPALVGLKVDNKSKQKLAGIRTKAEIALLISNQQVSKESGEIQFTAYGISGIPVFQISRYAAKALLEGETVEAVLSLLPDFTKEELLAYFEHQGTINEYKTILQTLQNLMDARLAETILDYARLNAKKSMGDVQIEELIHLVNSIKEYRQPITGTNGYEQAQVTGGGVSTQEVNPETLESKYHKGIYITGELLDVDGTCGGYNLQWAFTSGYVAAMSALKD